MAGASTRVAFLLLLGCCVGILLFCSVPGRAEPVVAVPVVDGWREDVPGATMHSGSDEEDEEEVSLTEERTEENVSTEAREAPVVEETPSPAEGSDSVEEGSEVELTVEGEEAERIEGEVEELPGDEEEGEGTDSIDGVTVDPLAMDVDCSKVHPFPEELFARQNDPTKVYDKPAVMPDGIFKSMGFERYVTVFGIPIIASSGVPDETLREAGHILAGMIDNDKDGLVDRPSAIQSVRDYRAVVSYVRDADESDFLWTELYTKPENQPFREQFACNMHFFEQWAADATPDFYVALAKREAVREVDTSAADRCDLMRDVDFDWRLWYSPFTLTYYGYLEDFSSTDLEMIEKAMAHARDEGIFFGNYPDDFEMETADFFVWSVLTKLGALECHCRADIIEGVWKICSANGLREFDSEWFDFLDTLEGIPKALPGPVYDSAALVVSREGDEEAEIADDPAAEPYQTAARDEEEAVDEAEMEVAQTGAEEPAAEEDDSADAEPTETPVFNELEAMIA